MGRFIPESNWDYMPYEQIKELQDKKLRYFIKHQVYAFSPYYRRLFDNLGIHPDEIRTTEDLVKLPFTEKKDIVSTPESPGRPAEFILQPDEESIGRLADPSDLEEWSENGRISKSKLDYEYKPVHLVFTTGRTSLPTPFYYTKRDLEVFQESMRRALSVIGCTENDVLLGAMPYAPHLGFWCGFYMSQGFGIRSLLTGGGKVTPTSKLIDLCENMRATVIHIMTGYVYHFLRTAAEQKRDFSSLRRVLIGGQRVPTGFREKLLELLEEMGAKDARIINTFGFTESKIGAGIECADGGDQMGYHTLPDLGVFEVIDPKTGKRVGEGEPGELVYTPLEMRGTCVVRYRLGDIASGGITYQPCPVCGRTTPRVSSDLSRSTDFKDFTLTKLKSTLVNLNSFYTIVGANKDVMEWQVEIRKRNDDPFDVDELYLYIAPRKGADWEKLKHKLAAEILDVTEVSPNGIEFCDLPRLLDRLGMETEIKERRIVDRRPVK